VQAQIPTHPHEQSAVHAPPDPGSVAWGGAGVLGQAFASLGLFCGVLSSPTNGQQCWAMQECSTEQQVQGMVAAMGAGAAAAPLL
jgi:hypothetical protein